MRPLTARLYMGEISVSTARISCRCPSLADPVDAAAFASAAAAAAPYDLFQAGFAIITMGRRCARMYSSCILGSPSDRMTLPIDMKKPKVAPEPSIYWPSVLMIPLGPAP